MSDREPQVLLVSAATLLSGGGERHVADLIRWLPERGVRVSLAAPSGGDLGSLAARLRIPFYAIDIASGFALGGLRTLRAAIHESAPDIVHAHGSRAAFWTRLADARASERVVYTLHGIHVGDISHPSLRQRTLLTAERALVTRAVRFVTVCESDRDKGARLRILDPDRTSVIYNGIEVPDVPPKRGVLRREIGVAEDVPLVISIGRLNPQKDQSTLLRAWALVHETIPDAIFVLIGEGRLESFLRSLSDRWGLSAALRILSPRADVASVYADADVFCLSSLWEGLPYVVLEAMAHGLPVVATAVDGVREAVLDGKSGLLVPSGDPDAMAESIVRLLRDRSLASGMGGVGARRVAELFTVGRMIDEYVSLYHILLQSALP